MELQLERGFPTRKERGLIGANARHCNSKGSTALTRADAYAARNRDTAVIAAEPDRGATGRSGRSESNRATRRSRSIHK
jgi:hypothetical protein